MKQAMDKDFERYVDLFREVLPKIDPTWKSYKFKTVDGKVDSKADGNNMEGRPVDIYVMDPKNFIPYSMW